MAAGDADDPIVIPIEGELDLHAFRPRDIAAVVDEFIAAAQAAGLAEVRLVHGRGKGVQRGIVQAALEHHPGVVEFYDDTRSHLGATIARLAPGGSGPGRRLTGLAGPGRPRTRPRGATSSGRYPHLLGDQAGAGVAIGDLHLIADAHDLGDRDAATLGRGGGAGADGDHVGPRLTV